MTDEPALVEARSVGKVFAVRNTIVPTRSSEVVAVDDVSFALHRGESLGIVGESGSGKTTIARMLVGLERPTSGAMFLSGRQIGLKRTSGGARKQNAGEIQIVFQNPYQSLDPRQRISSCIEEPLALHSSLSRRERKERARELLAEVGLDQRVAESFPRALSGGQRQRVAIARALAVRPRILILDEAVASLDVSVQAQVLNVITEIKEREGVALLVITHDLAVANQICDSLIVIQSGRVVERGPTRQVLDSPEHPYTRLLRAAVPTPGWKPVHRHRDGTGVPTESDSNPAPVAVAAQAWAARRVR
jgi:ABC-type glutathione transport system ATPase component